MATLTGTISVSGLPIEGSCTTPSWDNVTNKPFTTVDTTTGLTILDDTLMLETNDTIATITYVDNQISAATENIDLSDYATISYADGLTSTLATTSDLTAATSSITVDWSDVDNKPFSTVDTGGYLQINNDELSFDDAQLNSDLNIPQQVEDELTNGNLSIYDDNNSTEVVLDYNGNELGRAYIHAEWADIQGTQSDVSLSGFDNDLNISDFNNDSGYVTSGCTSGLATTSQLTAATSTMATTGITTGMMTSTDCPTTTDGTYILQATVSNNSLTYNWTALSSLQGASF